MKLYSRIAAWAGVLSAMPVIIVTFLAHKKIVGIPGLIAIAISFLFLTKLTNYIGRGLAHDIQQEKSEHEKRIVHDLSWIGLFIVVAIGCLAVVYSTVHKSTCEEVLVAGLGISILTAAAGISLSLERITEKHELMVKTNQEAVDSLHPAVQEISVAIGASGDRETALAATSHVAKAMKALDQNIASLDNTVQPKVGPMMRKLLLLQLEEYAKRLASYQSTSRMEHYSLSPIMEEDTPLWESVIDYVHRSFFSVDLPYKDSRGRMQNQNAHRIQRHKIANGLVFHRIFSVDDHILNDVALMDNLFRSMNDQNAIGIKVGLICQRPGPTKCAYSPALQAHFDTLQASDFILVDDRQLLYTVGYSTKDHYRKNKITLIADSVANEMLAAENLKDLLLVELGRNQEVFTYAFLVAQKHMANVSSLVAFIRSDMNRQLSRPC